MERVRKQPRTPRRVVVEAGAPRPAVEPRKRAVKKATAKKATAAKKTTGTRKRAAKKTGGES